MILSTATEAKSLDHDHARNDIRSGNSIHFCAESLNSRSGTDIRQYTFCLMTQLLCRF